ncbi:Chaperone of endosialidase, partial [Candidatus Methanomarinus sp.]
VYIGRSSGALADGEFANYNTYLGAFTGTNSLNGRSNVFLGYAAGNYETGSHKLYIENSYDFEGAESDVRTPLIYGEFDNDILSINGKLGVSNTTGNFSPTYELDVDGYVRTKYFMQRSEAPQMRWYETDAADPNDFFKMNYHSEGFEFIWFDASSVTTYVPLVMKGQGYVGINNAEPTHMLDVGSSGAYCDGGVWVDGSSLQFKENVSGVGLDEAKNVLKKLNPIKYNYKNNKEEQYLGFIAEEVPELVAMKDRKGMYTMDVVTVLTKVVQDQQKKIQSQNEKIEKLEEKYKKSIKSLLKRIEKLETK